MSDIRKLSFIQIAVIIVFALFKLVRGEMLDSPNSLIVVLGLSLPNLFEGIIGITFLAAVGLFLFKKSLSRNVIYVFALFMASVYVISQELKFHNLGGNNVYDPMDLVFSGIGLVIGFVIVFYLKPRLQ